MKLIEIKTDPNSGDDSHIIEQNRLKLEISKFRMAIRFKINNLGESITNLSNLISKKSEQQTEIINNFLNRIKNKQLFLNNKINSVKNLDLYKIKNNYYQIIIEKETP